MIDRTKYLRYFIISMFLMVPVVSSFISVVHLNDLLLLGNIGWISILLSVVYEIGSLAAFITPFVFKRINRPMIFSIFTILVFMQIVGNIYSSFHYINVQLLLDSNWLGSFKELISYFVGDDVPLVKIIVSSLISLPIPIISLLFLKSMVDYIETGDLKEIPAETKTEIIKESEIYTSEEIIEPKELTLEEEAESKGIILTPEEIESFKESKEKTGKWLLDD